MVALPFPLLEAQGDFSVVFTVRTCSTPRDKFHNITKASLTGSPWSFNSQTCPHWASLQQFLIYSSSFSIQALVPTGVSDYEFPFLLTEKSLYFPVSPILGAVLLPRDFTSLTELRSVVDFSIYLFTCCQGRMVTFNLLTCQTRNLQTRSWKYFHFYLSILNVGKYGNSCRVIK